MKLLCTTLAAAVGSILICNQAHAQLEHAEFETLLAQLQPDDSEPWRQIPWNISVLEGQRVAAAEGKPEEIRSIDLRLENGKLTGSVKLETADGRRGFDAELYGVIETKAGKVSRFDVVASGQFHGHGRYTRNPPPGRFPLGIAFSLADGSDVADAIPPQGSRGWVRGYIR